MKKYLKPEIRINEFENNNVISTSCTCPTNCYHVQDIQGKLNAMGTLPEYFYFHNDEKSFSYLPNVDWTNNYNRNYSTPDGTCVEHGNYYKATKKHD